MADHYLGGAAVLAWVAGIVSVLATLVAGSNSQARMLFDGGRSGLLPAWLGHVREPVYTPVNALLLMAGAGLGIIGVWWSSHLVGVNTGSMNLWGAFIRSGMVSGGDVLVGEAAEPVVSADRGGW